jgi:hypothetical protein
LVSATALPSVTGAPRVRERVEAWNEALDSHDVAGLAALYFRHARRRQSM